MRNQKGFITVVEIVIIVVILVLLSIVPVACHQEITRKQAMMAKTGVEMSYWDIFWINPELRYNQGEIVIKND